jgi:hypothetical protein
LEAFKLPTTKEGGLTKFTGHPSSLPLFMTCSKTR